MVVAIGDIIVDYAGLLANNKGHPLEESIEINLCALLL
jgi:hypothetical protein